MYEMVSDVFMLYGVDEEFDVVKFFDVDWYC